MGQSCSADGCKDWLGKGRPEASKALMVLSVSAEARKQARTKSTGAQLPARLAPNSWGGYGGGFAVAALDPGIMAGAVAAAGAGLCLISGQ